MVNSGNWVVKVKEKCVSYTQKPGNSRPESSVDLRGAKLHWANELSSKKNVFKVRNKTPKKWNKDCKTCKKLWQTCGFILLKSFSRIFFISVILETKHVGFLSKMFLCADTLGIYTGAILSAVREARMGSFLSPARWPILTKRKQ